MLVAAVVIWLITALSGKAATTIRQLKDSRARYAILAGAAFGPFVGVWLSLVAIQHARIGIASTLMSLTPVILIPLVWWIFKERITFQAVLGTIVAVGGVALLFLI
jgi:drug/metabolite transporter (DMT)-like permease